MRVQWFRIYSFWLFVFSIFSAFYIIPSTFPLNIIALIGIFEIMPDLKNESFSKILFILGLHVGPLLWVPIAYDRGTLLFCVALSCAYLIFMRINNYSIIQSYTAILTQSHPTFASFLSDRE